MELIIIAAISENGVIGRGKTIPWFDTNGRSRIKSDILRFKALTLGEAVVMGRTTYEAVGGALPGRRNVILSRDPAFVAPDAAVARNRDEAMRLFTGSRTFVIGGGSVFAEFLPLVSRMELTIVEERFDGDIFFPPYDPFEWRIAALERRTANPAAGDHFPFRYETWLRSVRPSASLPD